jgi:transcriptional regulator with XRE-family HTH domain
MKYSFGERLKELRSKRGLSQEELADNLNEHFGSSINKGMISKWENDREEPRMEAVRNLAKFFNLKLDSLLDLNNPSVEDINKLSLKEERDIASDLERMIGELESNEAMAFHGEPMDDETKELMRISLENSLRLAKGMAKQKFNPNKNK